MVQPVANENQDPYFEELKRIIQTAWKSESELYKAIVNAPFHNPLRALEYDLGAVVLLLVNQSKKTIDRVALSDTLSAQGAVRMSAKPFEKIKIPIGHKVNLIARAIETGKPQITQDWKFLFVPALTAREAQFNQAGAGIETSCIYPVKGSVNGALIFSFFQPQLNIGSEHTHFMQSYSSLVERILN